MLKYANTLLVARVRLQKRILDLYPEVKNEDNWNIKLSQALEVLREDTLNAYSRIKPKLRTWFFDIFPRLNEIPREERTKYDEIFHDRDAYITDDTERKRLATIVKDHERYGQVVDTDDLRFIFSIYARAPYIRVSEVLRDLGAMLSTNFARENNLISEDKIRDLAIATYGSALSILPEEIQKKYIRALGQGDTPLLSIDDIDKSRLPTLLEDPIVRYQLSQEVISTLDRPILEKDRYGDDTVSRIRKRKINEAEKRGRDES